MAYITYSTSELETRVVRYKCCFANTGYSLLKSEQNQTDNKGCLTNKFNYLNQGIKTLERYIKKILPLQISFDFSDLEDLAYPITRTFQFYFNEGKLIEVIITGDSYEIFVQQIFNVFVEYQEETGLVPTLVENVIYLNLGCKSYTSAEILLVEGINSYWDLTDLNVDTSAFSFTIVRNDNSDIIIDFPIKSYSDLNDLIQEIVGQINSQGDFFAYQAGFLIYLQSLTNPGINVELTLNLTNPFQIQIDPSFDPASITFQIQGSTLDSGNASVYNPDDENFWFIGSNNAGGGNVVIVITDQDGTTIQSTEDADYNNSFIFTRGIYDPNTKRIYVSPIQEVSSGDSGILVIDADSSSGTYGEVIDFWVDSGTSISGNKLFLHSDGTIYLFGVNDVSEPTVYCFDDTGTLVFSTSLTNDSEHNLETYPFWDGAVQIGLDVVFSTKNRIIKIDGDSSSGTYGDVLVNTLIDDNSDFQLGNIVDNGTSLNFISSTTGNAEDKIYEINYDIDSFFEVIDLPTSGTEAGRFLIFVNDLLFVSGQSFYALYDTDYNLLTFSHLEDVVSGDTPAIIYGAANTNDEKLFYNYFLVSYVGVFATTETSYTYDLDIADIDISSFEPEETFYENELCDLSQEAISNIIENLDGYCCDNCQDNLNLIKDIND